MNIAHIGEHALYGTVGGHSNAAASDVCGGGESLHPSGPFSLMQ